MKKKHNMSIINVENKSMMTLWNFFLEISFIKLYRISLFISEGIFKTLYPLLQKKAGTTALFCNA